MRLARLQGEGSRDTTGESIEAKDLCRVNEASLVIGALVRAGHTLSVVALKQPVGAEELRADEALKGAALVMASDGVLWRTLSRGVCDFAAIANSRNTLATGALDGKGHIFALFNLSAAHFTDGALSVSAEIGSLGRALDVVRAVAWVSSASLIVALEGGEGGASHKSSAR